MKFLYSIFLITVCSVIFQSCARKGSPEGGPKDEDAPIMVIAKPSNGSLNFDEKSIRIYFDEYIVLKDLSKQLIISPPLKNNPLITPQGIPSKYINIKILDTLKGNTTYTFNFGDAVQDNNEGNALENFKYVFSTGDYIDSLTIKGGVRDIKAKELSKNYSVLLYKADTTFNDSVPYRRKPDYVTKTYDSVNYNFSNIKEGKYFLMAIDEENPDYKFSSATEKIGFLNDTIYLPKDSVIKKSIILFQEKQPYKFKRAKQIKKGKIQFGFTGGNKKDFKVKLLSKAPENYKDYTLFEEEKDTLNLWYTDIEADSLQYIITHKEEIDTATVFLRKKKIDSLVVSNNIKNVLHLTDTFKLTTNNPVVKIDTTKFSLVESDSIPVPFKLKGLTSNEIGLMFDKKQKSKYTFTGLPNAIKDVYEVQSKDTLVYSFNTKEEEDYGTIILDIKKKVKSPVIIEILDKDVVVKKEYVKSSKKLEFTLLEPKEYVIKAVVDENENGKWDTGVLLGKKQPERIIYLEEVLQLRANWSINQVFEIDKE